MKAQEFSSVLKSFADVLDISGSSIARDNIIMLTAAFDADPGSSISTFVNRIDAMHGSEPAGSPSVGDVARLLSALNGLLGKTAKASVLADVNSIEALLRRRASMEISAFVRMCAEAAAPRRKKSKRGATKVQDELVLHYKEKLEASLGDEERFTDVYDDLRTNTAVGKPDILALAKQMTGGGARTVDAALKKIWNRHRSLVVFKAKSRATGGRSAA